MKKQNILLLPLCMMLSGCFFAIYPNRFDPTVQLDRFREGTDTHIDELINIDGYYAGVPDDSTYREHVSTFMFYKDGTYGIFQFMYEYPFLKMRDVYLPGKIYAWPYYKDKAGGNYVVHGDTIVADAYCLRKSRWRIDRLKFKAVSRDTLLLFERETDVTVNGRHTQRTECNQLYSFIPAKLPVPESFYIKRKKWMWEKEEEWKRNKLLYKPTLEYWRITY